MTENIKDKKRLLKTVLAVTFAFAVFKITSTLAISHISDGIVKIFITEIILFICAICAVCYTRSLGELKLSSKGILKGQLIGLYVFAMALLRSVIWLVDFIYGEEIITVSALAVVLFLISMVLVGISEELLFRGVLLKGYLEYYGEDSTGALRKSIVISSLIFGLLHIFNILIGASLIGTVVQAINGIALGMILGTIYVRCGKNIWPCVILHSFHDFSAFISSGMLRGATLGDTVSGYDVSIIPSIIILYLIAIFIMRKKKL